METLMEMRNSLLEKLEKKRKLGLCSHGIRNGDSTVNRLIPKGDGHKGQQRNFMRKKKNKISEKQKRADDWSKNNKIGDFLKKRKRNNETDCFENPSLISLFMHQKKKSNLSKKLNTTDHFSKKRSSNSDCSKKKSKGSNCDQLLSSHSKEKVNGNLLTESLKRKRKIKKKTDGVVQDEASRLQRKAKYLLVKLKLEQSLIDAYTGEGWKGQSREKIRPEKELQRAKKQVLNCKLGIRDTVRQLDLLGSVGKIGDSFISSDGSVHHEHIFCKKCKTQEVSEDNDIILCDGTCNCAFHQKCIDPPLATEDIPPEDEGWLCKYCDCKMDLLDAVNAHLGTQFSDDCAWQDIFKEEAHLSDTMMIDFNHEEKWPDDESDDYDYDPEKCNAGNENGSSEECSTSSSSGSLESEVYWESGLLTESNDLSSNIPHLHQNCVTDFDNNKIISRRRERHAVDYIKLYDEMFAKDVSSSDVFSEDEDWDPRKRRRRKKESDAATTLMTLGASEMKPSDSQIEEAGKDIPLGEKARKPSRIPGDILQKLRQAFAENELPSSDVKKDISNLVGLEYRKVHKWFKNARYSALKNRKKEGSLQCTTSKKSDNEVEKNVNPIVPKSSPISVRKKLLKKKVSWNDNLTTLISSAKVKRLKRVTLGDNKAHVELTDDMSLKRHLLHLKAKSRREKRGKHNSKHPQVVTPEMQMEQLCQIEAKLWKLKQIVSKFQKATSDDVNDQCIEGKHVVYVPFAEVKEKL